jgi:protease-4
VINVGASAPYMVALHTDKIYAANYSLVGSVGVVLTGWDFHALRSSRSASVYARGNLKSMLNPHMPMTPEAVKARKWFRRWEKDSLQSSGRLGRN